MTVAGAIEPVDLLGLDRAGLTSLCRQWGEKPFRGQQLMRWMHRRYESDVNAMTDLSRGFRERVASLGRIQPPAILSDRTAADGTRKWLLDVGQGNAVESVFIPEANRGTLCISTQAGCAVNCAFCSTGKQGFARNLTSAEIVGQVWLANRLLGPRSQGADAADEDGHHDHDRRITNVVFMGMGEPLLNSEAVLAAIDCLCTDLGMAQRQITVSTVGVARTLPQLAELALARLGRAQFTLAVSLHAPDQRLREQLIPTAHAYPIAELLEDCRRFVAITGRRVSFEYILLGGLNDQPRHAEALAQLLRGFQSHVNLIPYNPIAEEEFQRPTPAAVEGFRRALQARHVAVSVRASRGLDADAACGQLRRRLEGSLEPVPAGRA